MKTKLFNLLINNSVHLYAKPMPFVKSMQNKLKKEAQYRGCTFKITYNTTTL